MGYKVIMEEHLVYIADSRTMQEIATRSVHLIITSPPYWQLKDYDDTRQIGFHDSYEEYINNLNLVWNECYRVLYDGCRLCVNIGDQFARSVYYGRYKVIPIRTEIIKFCEAIGLDYMGAIIWQKVTTCNTTGGATIMGSYPYPRNGIVKIDYEFILLFKKSGHSPPVGKNEKELSKLSVAEWNEYFAGHWNFPGEKQDKHLAMFPEELPRRLIRMFSFVGETVLDPFLGSGTTSMAAKRLQRCSIGYEINASFLPVIRRKLGVEQASLLDRSHVEFIEPERKALDHKQEIRQLPYVFKDPVHFEKKIDPRKRTFGSKIELDQKDDMQYFRMQRVIAPNLIELDNDQIIRLMGIRAKSGRESEAMGWLWEKLKGQNIFLRHDKVRHDESNILLSYIYLKNKTFVNLHLLRTNLVQIDTAIPFKHFEKFNAIQQEEILK